LQVNYSYFRIDKKILKSESHKKEPHFRKKGTKMRKFKKINDTDLAVNIKEIEQDYSIEAILSQ